MSLLNFSFRIKIDQTLHLQRCYCEKMFFLNKIIYRSTESWFSSKIKGLFKPLKV